MESVTSLAGVEGRRDLFRRHVLRSGRFALRYSQERRHDDEALDRQRDNILQALDACDRYADASQIVVDITLNMHSHMARRGYWEIWERYLERVVEGSRRLGDARAEGTLLNYLGEIRREKGLWKSALGLHEEARQIFEGLQDEAGRARSYQHLGCLWWLRGRWDRAWDCFQVALEMAEGLEGNRSRSAELHSDVGRLCSYRGEWKKALAYLQQAAQMAAQLGNPATQIQAQTSTGYVHWRRGEWREARHVLRQAIGMATRYNYEIKLAIAYNNLAAVLLSQGDWKQALDYLERDLGIVEPVGAVHLAAHAYDDMGEAYRQAGQWEKGQRYLERSAEIKCGLDDLSGLAATYHHLGLLCTDTGEHERALDYHRQALRLRERLGAEQDIAEVAVSLAWAYRRHCSTLRQGSGQCRARDEMRAAAERAWALTRRLNRRDLLTRLLWLDAEVALEEGRTVEAHAAYQQALETSRRATSSPVSPVEGSYGNDRLLSLYRETQVRMNRLNGQEERDLPGVPRSSSCAPGG
jgi:tetratricopeptide (TPR) repeat protein